GDFPGHCNREGVGLERLEDEEEVEEVRTLIGNHVRYTGSALGQEILEHWEERVSQFVKVMPHDYKRMLEAFQRVEAQGMSGEEAALTAFREGVAV
ncbi:MAG: hypothetical protein ABIG68_05560, partial [Acidobacteriota bacterium]